MMGDYGAYLATQLAAARDIGVEARQHYAGFLAETIEAFARVESSPGGQNPQWTEGYQAACRDMLDVVLREAPSLPPPPSRQEER